jgi:hypothetical protein
MGLPIGGTLNRLNIVSVYSPSYPIRSVVVYSQPVAVPAPVRPPPPPPAPDVLRVVHLPDPPPPPLIIPKLPIYNLVGVSKLNSTLFEQASADFARNKPQVYFVVDYVVDGTKIGNLIVFKKYKTATHYEIFKRNIFTEISSFQRILFLDSADLLAETKQYSTYLSEHLGLNNLPEETYYCIMDPLVKYDRIYEYKVVASRIPRNAGEVDYDYILESKGLTQLTKVDSVTKSGLNNFSVVNLGSQQLSWIIALLNRGLSFFDVHTLLNPLSDILGPNASIVVPKNVAHIKSIFDDSVSLFGIDQTLVQIISLLGGLSSDFRNSFNESLNNLSKTFSYNAFISSCRAKVPAFNLLLSISEHAGNESALKRLSQLSISVPNKVGTETYTTIEGLSNIFYFMQSIIFVVIRVQDNSVELETILAELNKPPPPPPPPPPAPPAPIQIIGQPPARPVVLLPPAPVLTISRSPITTSGLGGTIRLR